MPSSNRTLLDDIILLFQNQYLMISQLLYAFLGQPTWGELQERGVTWGDLEGHQWGDLRNVIDS